MNKKQKLKNAVILGLLMSSVTASSAWAWVPVQAPGWTENRDSNSAERIENHLDYNTQKGELEFGIWAHSNKVVLDYIGVANVNADSLTIDVYNNFFANNKDGNWAVGILAGEKKYDVADGNLSSWVNVNTKNGLVVNVKTRNAEDGYGVFANKLGHIDINNSNGDVYINVQKSLGYGTPGISDENVRYDLSNVYAIKAISDGNVKINSENGNVFVSAFYNKDDAELNNKLKEGNIYGVSNIGGTVDLHAGNVISITANSANGDAYGIYTNSDNFTTLNSEYNQITAVADGNGTAIGIKAENGSKVDIIGNTFVHGDNGALVIQGNNGKDISEQVTVDGNLFASADIGTVKKLTDGASEHVKGNLISASGDKDNAYSNISLTDCSSLTVDGYAVIQGGKTGLELNNSTVTYGKDGVSNYIIANDKAVSMNNNSALTVNGSSMFIATDAKSTAIEVAQDSQFTSNGSVTVGGGANGIVLDTNSQFTVKDADINFIKASMARTDVTEDDEHYNAVNVGAGAQFDVSGKINILQAGNLADGFGSETAVSVVGGAGEDKANFELKGSDGNIVQGAVYTQNGKVDITSENGNNVIYSSAHGYQEVDETADDGNPVKGNALGIAVSAGGRDIDVENGILKPAGEIGEVNINYGSDFYRSMIVGDIVAGYGGEINITSNSIMPLVDEEFTQGNSLNVKGNILAANGGSTTVDFGTGGYWEGRADDYGDANITDHKGFYNPAFSNEIVEGGEVNITMQHGMWNVTAQSWLTSFNGDNNIIDMVSYEDNGTHAVSIKEMIGKNNTFVMGLNNKDHGNSDMLYIKGGDANIDVVVSGTIEDLDKVSEENGLRFATVGEGITFGKEENGRKYITGINTGMFNTRLYVKDSEYVKGDVDNDGYNGDKLDGDKPGSDSVEDFFKPDEDTPEVLDLTATNENINADNWEIVDFAQDGMSDVGKTVLDLSKVNYSNAVYMDRFNKRMGEARFIDGNEGMWVRLRHDRIGKEDSFRSMNTMYEMGYDVKQVKEDGEHRVGFAIDYMDGSSSFSQVAGTGEVSRKGLWMYDSWMGEKGHYRDFVAKWGHLSNDFEFMAGSDEAKADFSNNVYSISAEFGKKNDIGNSWYFEPQAQVQYAHVTGAEYTTSLAGADQTEIRNDAFNSLIARAGFRLGRDISNTSTVYFKGDVLHEFLGDQDVFAKDSTTSGQWQSVGYDHSGTWYDIGFGFATKINKASYAYLDFEKSFGNDYDETYQINAGLQWTF